MICDYVAVDVETTGLNPVSDKLIEIGAIKVVGFEVVQTFTTLINPGMDIPWRITQITGITDEMVLEAPAVGEVMGELADFCGDMVLLGHNIRFDYSFLKQNFLNLSMDFEASGLDTLKIARKLLPDFEKRNLDYLCKVFDIKDDQHHRACNDANAASLLYRCLLERYGGENPQIFEVEKLSYKGAKICPITPKQKAFLGALINHHNLLEEYEVDKLSKNEASRIIDKIILNYGRMK
ncbi:3'-5' exonuclease [Parasporobacterium paucivorans]|uniref:DNA polymerase-3 subunit alpha n=1 Tax=Parasporobacterium paucivorans DSM 15970 TaxID=1122934 RepID=A0A1M6CV14_9FIRM|nr:3'-5' exonuclease [Parasporobacterium paucivorans]SHI64681.1 DNA polymerase-3 subunit alpha [Parasporobacterium paucivorans DSM 15970]